MVGRPSSLADRGPPGRTRRRRARAGRSPATAGGWRARGAGGHGAGAGPGQCLEFHGRDRWHCREPSLALRGRIPLRAWGPVAGVVLPDGDVVVESLGILHWSLRQKDPGNWLAAHDKGLIEQNDGPFKASLDRYKYPHRYGLEDGTEHRDAGLAILDQLDSRLSEHAFLSGVARGLTDIAIFPFIRQFAATDQSWFDAQPLADLRRWLGHHLASDLFAGIMYRYPRWQTGDAPTIFP